MVTAIRGSRVAVRAPERRVAEPHSIAFSCRRQIPLWYMELYWGMISNISRMDILSTIYWVYLAVKGQCENSNHVMFFTETGNYTLFVYTKGQLWFITTWVIFCSVVHHFYQLHQHSIYQSDYWGLGTEWHGNNEAHQGKRQEMIRQ